MAGSSHRICDLTQFTDFDVFNSNARTLFEENVFKGGEIADSVQHHLVLPIVIEMEKN
jgi:hypothetical protein